MERKTKSHLTNEDLCSKFQSKFELVNYAIKLADNMIKSGREARVKSDLQNRAMLILEEIYEGKDQFVEISHSVTATHVAFPDLEGALKQQTIYEENPESKKYRTAGNLSEEE